MYSQINGEDHTLPVPPYNCDSSNISAKYVINPQNVGPNIPPKESQNPTQVIYVQVPAIPPLGSQPVQVTCPSCKTVVQTHVEENASNMAYILCTLLCIVGCFCFACVPFCTDNLKKYMHTCPSCNAFIGVFQP